MRPQILVIGYGEEHCPEKAYSIAYRVGREVARRGAVLVTGGLGGVMEAASKGAKEAGGIVLGIIPQDSKTYANPYCDIVIPTGMGYSRDFLTAYTADAVVVVGGGAGTMIEVCYAYLKCRPIVSVVGSGGVADSIVGTYLDDRRLVEVVGEEDPQRAVERALNLLAKKVSK